MASSFESTIEKTQILSHDSGADSEKTVIRKGELLDASPSVGSSINANDHRDSRVVTDLLLGKELDHFLLESLIGTGGMGAVFRGRDLRLDREVAIKVVPIGDRGAEAMRRFRFEAQSAAKLDHPNIARVYYVGETDQWSYIVFEFVEGTNLRDLVLRQGPLTIDDAVGMTRQISEALQHAYDRNVVHRDIKPSNILVTSAGQAKLVDMGLARNTELDKSTNDLTASGVTLGTFDYISPEQAHDPRNADVRSDIYSLGCTLYFLLTGQPPFPEGTALQKLLLHGTKLPDDPRHFRSDISDSLIAILRKMMAKKPIDRYQEPSDLIHDLRILAKLEGLEWAKSSDTTVGLPNTAQRTWFEASLPLLISFAVIAGIGFWQWLHSISYQNAVFAIPREEIPEIALKEQAEKGAGETNSAFVESTSKSNTNATTSQPITDSNVVTTPPPRMEKSVESLPETIFVLPQPLQDKDKTGLSARNIEQAIEMTKTQSQLRRIVVRTQHLTTNMSGLRPIELINDVLIQPEPGSRFRWTFEPTESALESNEMSSCILVGDQPVVLQDVDIEWRVSGTSRRRSLFSLHPGSKLQLKNCSITVIQEAGPLNAPGIYGITNKRNMRLPAVVSIMDNSDTNEEVGADKPNRPARVNATSLSVRGQCDWLQHRTAGRTEVHLENSWFAIAGSMFETSGVRTMSRQSVPLRIEMLDVTSFTLRSWMTSVVSNQQPYPTPVVRIAKDCVFSGTTSLIEWNALDCQDWRVWEQSEQGHRINRWIDLRGRDNTYDNSWLHNFLVIRMNSGAVETVPMETSPLLENDEERGLETEASWMKRPAFEPSKIHEATHEAFEFVPRSFQPGFRAQQ